MPFYPWHELEAKLRAPQLSWAGEGQAGSDLPNAVLIYDEDAETAQFTQLEIRQERTVRQQRDTSGQRGESGPTQDDTCVWA